MKKNWFAKGCSILLAGSMVFSLAACSKDDGQQNVNNEEAKKYVFDYEEFDIGLSEYDGFNINSMEYKDGKIYVFANADNYGETYESKKLLIRMNPDGSERTEIELKQPQGQNDAAGGGVTDDMLRSDMASRLPETEEVPEEDAPVDEAPEEDAPADEPAANEEDAEEDILKLPGTDEGDLAGQVLTNTYYERIMVGEDDTILCVEVVSKDDYTVPEAPVYTSETNIICWDMDQNELWRAPLQEYIADMDYFYVSYFLQDSKGNIYIVSDKKCIVFDKNGNNIGAGNFDVEWINRAYIDNEDNLQVITYSNDGSKQVISTADPKTGKLSETKELEGTLSNYNIIGPGLGHDLIMTSSAGLFGYNFNGAGSAEGTNVTQIMSFINSDLNATYLENVVAIDEDRFVAGYWDNTDNEHHISIFTPVAPEDIPDKQAIVIGCNYIDWDVRNRIIAFNKSSKEYRITIRDYSVYNNSENWTAGMTQLNNDILSGKVPDILIVQNDMPMDSYINKGLFADFNEFIEKDEELDKNDYLANVFEAYSVKGKLYQLTPSFMISTCAAKTKWVGDREIWSIKDMQDILAQMPEGASAFGETYSREDMLTIALQYISGQFMDRESGKCNFDSQEFKDLLMYISTLPSSKDIENTFGEDYWKDYDVQWREDKTLLHTSGIYSFSDFNRMMQGYLGEEYAIVGFPSAPEKGAVITPNMCFAVSAKSECKEGVWEFLRYYLTDEYQESVEWGLPINEEMLKAAAEKAMKNPSYIDEAGNEVEYEDTFYVGGNEVKINPLTAQEAEQMVNYVKSINKTWNYNYEVNDIISEEAAAFFEGQKTVDEVVSIIQSRVQIYVDENR